MAAKENELWAQTIFSITPQENGTIREIKEETKISGSSDTDLELDSNNISLVEQIRPSRKHFLDPAELRKKSHIEVECQTLIQNVDKAHIPIEYINEATQTFYIGKQCLITNAFEVVIAAIDKSIPPLKTGQVSQTTITFNGNYSQHILTDQLFLDHNDKDFVVSVEEVSKIEAWHFLNHIIERVFWISDPDEPIVKKDEAETQTLIICNSRSGKAIFNQETQTGLTCKPKDSNSELLSDYLEIKNLVRSCLEDFLVRSVYGRILVDDIIDEVLDKCSQEIRFPFTDNATQTLASCKILEDRDEDVVRKLRLPVVVDPLESLIVLAPLIEKILRGTYIEVSKNAGTNVKKIICKLIERTILMREERRKEASNKPMDHIFLQRKRLLAQSMRKKPETRTASTQTKIAGFPEVEKLKEQLKVPCSVCTRESECRWCSGPQKDFNPAVAKVYNNPVYVPKKDEEVSQTCSKISGSKTTYSDFFHKTSDSTDSAKRKLSKKILASSSRGSQIDLPPSKILSIPGFGTCDDSVSEKSTRKSSKSANKFSKSASKSSKSACKLPCKDQSQTSSKSQSDLPPQAAAALQILKSAFCTRETCPNKGDNSEIDSTFSEGNEDSSTSKEIPKQNAQST